MTSHRPHDKPQEAPPASLSMELTNYRAFQNSGGFRLAPLTLLVGANSTGKSSIMSALLVLKQSIEQELIGSRVGPLILSGAYCDLGQYADVEMSCMATRPDAQSDSRSASQCRN